MNQLRSRPAVTAPRGKRPDPGPLGDARTDLLVIGSGRRLDAVASSLSSLRLVIRTARPSEAMLPSSGSVIGVVLVEPLGGFTAAQAVLSIRNRRDGKQLPIFVVIGPRPATRRIGDLYRMDVTAVFEWPREAGVFPHVVAELIGVTAVRGRPTREDSGLRRAVRARLKLHGISPGQVRVNVRDKEVKLSGTIDALWRKQALVRAVQRTPGARRVTASELRVEPPRRSDRALARSMREIVKAVSPELSRTVGVAVEGGEVTFAGNIPDRAQGTRLVRLAENVEGVRGVNNLLTISALQHRQDRHQARALQRAVSEMFPGEGVRIAVFGGVGVVSGTVHSLDAKVGIGEMLDDWKSLRRAINKIQVAD